MGGSGASISTRSGRGRIAIGARTARFVAANPIAGRRAVRAVNARTARGRGGNLAAIGRSRTSTSRRVRRLAARAR